MIDIYNDNEHNSNQFTNRNSSGLNNVDRRENFSSTINALKKNNRYNTTLNNEDDSYTDGFKPV